MTCLKKRETHITPTKKINNLTLKNSKIINSRKTSEKIKKRKMHSLDQTKI